MREVGVGAALARQEVRAACLPTIWSTPPAVDTMQGLQLHNTTSGQRGVGRI